MVLTLLLGFTCSTAWAQSNKISLEGITATRAEAGGRVRVIVNYTIPQQDLPKGSVSGASRRAMIATNRLNLLQSAFDGDFEAYQPKAKPHIFDRPTVVRPLETVPSMAMMLTLAEVEKLAADPRVTGIYTDKLMKPMLNDSTVIVGAPTVWATGSNGADYAVAVLDTGASLNHPMIAGRVVGSGCVSSTNILQGNESLCPDGTDEQLGGDAGTNCPVDDLATAGIVEGVSGCDHGTHVASTAMGGPVTSTTGVTIQGVARGANLAIIQVFSKFTDTAICDPEPSPCSKVFMQDMNKGLEIILDNAASLKIISVNLSLGFTGIFSTSCDTGEQMATKSLIDQLRAAGVATVIASGNDGSSIGISTPACISSAIAVGATTKQDAVAGFSNSSHLVDFLAPGESILAAYPVVGGFYYDDVKNGTSMATPHVAGAFALLKSANPGASVQDIEDALKATGVPIIDTRNLVIKPRIRVDRANALLSNGGGAGIGNLAITPADGFFRYGKIGNSGSFGTQTYTLTNNTGAGVNWSVAADMPFIVFNKTSGTLADGASDTVIVSVDVANVASGGFGGESGIITFAVGADTAMRTAAAAAVIPANDDFVDAEQLTGITPSTVGFNTYSSKEAGEPNHVDGTVGGNSNAGGGSVWYQWAALEDATVDVSTSGSDFDTVLGVYTGASISSLAAVANNDDEDNPNNILTSQLAFNAVAGTTYFIAVDGFRESNGFVNNGNISLSLVATPSSANSPPTGEVTINGAATQGETLTADTSTIGDADGLGSFNVQWRRGGASLAGATTSTYTLTQADVNSTVDVRVSYTDGGGTAESLTSIPTGAVTNVNDVPTGEVVITGNATQGEILTADASTVADLDGLGALLFQWHRAGADISGANLSTYTLTQADVGSVIAVTVSYTDGFGASESLTSAPTSAVQGLSQFTLTVAKTGPGSGTLSSNPAGIDCGADCEEAYDTGTSVTLTPAAGADSMFAAWSGACSGTGACVVNMDQARSVSVRFELTAPGSTTLFSSILPSARSGSFGGAPDRSDVSGPQALGDPVTVFASVINAGASVAQSCIISVPVSAPVSLEFQETNAANAPVGIPDAQFDVDVGQARSFILSLTPNALSVGEDVFPDFVCDNANVDAIPGVNTVFLSIDDHEVPDILSIGSTPSNDGIITVPSGSLSFMTASAINIGAGDAAGSADAAMSVSVDTGAAALSVEPQLCETDASSACITTLGTAPVSTVIGASPSFFAVFVSDQSGGNGVPLDPANARVFLRFKDAAGTTRSVTSAAVRVPAAADLPVQSAGGLPIGRWAVTVRKTIGVRHAQTPGVLYVWPDGMAKLESANDNFDLQLLPDSNTETLGAFIGLEEYGVLSGQFTFDNSVFMVNHRKDYRLDVWGVHDMRGLVDTDAMLEAK
jgi:Subtilase family